MELDELDLHTPKETMRHLRIADERTLRRLRDNGRIPHRKIGGRILYATEDIRTYIRSCRIVGSAVQPNARDPLAAIREELRMASSAMERLRSVMELAAPIGRS